MDILPKLRDDAETGLARTWDSWPPGVDSVTVRYVANIFSSQHEEITPPAGVTVTRAQWAARRFELGLPNGKEELQVLKNRKKFLEFGAKAGLEANDLAEALRFKSAQPTPCQEARDGAEAVGDFVDALHTPEHPYYLLAQALFGAYRQSAHGKGKERHANDLPFNEQPMQAISDLIGSGDGMAYQVIKKVQESLRMDRDAAIRELYGAIVYAAGMIVRLQAEDSTD